MFDDWLLKIKKILTHRLMFLYLAILVLSGILVYRCFTLQVLHGQEYLDNFVLEQEKTREVASTRGNIYDRNGFLLAYSELAYAVKVEDTFETGSSKNESLNELALNVIRLVEKNGDSIITDFKIYLDENREFAFSAEGSAQLRFLADVYDHASTSDLTEEERASTAEDVMKYLSRASGRGYTYAIGEYAVPGDKKSEFIPGRGYSRSDWLKVVTIRFAMSQTAYRKYVGTIVATDVCDETIAVILENSDILPGVTIVEDSVRRYVDSMYFAHILGYTGKISSEELAELNEAAAAAGEPADLYAISDVVGKSGIEKYMESTLQGTKGYENLMVDSTGRTISVLERRDPSAGGDVYLTIDHDLTIAVYNIVEQKLAGLVASKIINAKTYDQGNASSSKIQIPIYDVYYQMFSNNILDISHFGSANAQETEQLVYERFQDYRASAYDTLRAELTAKRTAYNRLKTEYQVYESDLVKLLTRAGVLASDRIDQTDPVYIAWTADETISLGEYLDHCIAKGWIDTAKLDLESKYAESTEIFEAVTERAIELADANAEFQKRFYKYMLLNDKIDGRTVCRLLYEQDAIEIPPNEMEQLNAGRISAYRFMMNRIENLDITPAQLALDPCNASVVITDVHTGQVLAMVTYPGYDNNKMANSVDADYYESLTSDQSSPLLNFATQYKAAPGSTFKIVTATAGLMEGVIGLRSSVHCTGTFTAIEPSPSCWNRWGHGNENVQTAIRDSCNFFFYEVGYRLATQSGTYSDVAGLNKLYEYADLYGLSDKSGVEIGEYQPEVSNLDAVRSSIGQGENSYTTTQLARYVTTIANRGTCYDLTLLDHTTNAAGDVTKVYESIVRNTVDLPDEYWDTFHRGMRAVVQNKSYFSDLAINVAGKTGTAEQVRNRPSHALFICFAPYENPELGMTVRIPFGYSSDYAAQFARDILKYYYGLAEEETLINGTADTPDGGITNEL